jgi:hypothetical protein
MMKTMRQWHLLLTLVALATLSGCGLVGWVAHGVAGGPPELDIKAEYKGLENKRVAVLVGADTATMYRQPLAQFEVAAILSERIAANVPGVKVVDARQVIDFQNRNIYWSTMSYSELAKRLDVDRIVTVEILEYRLHEPANINIWRGVITASLGVAETDGPKPNDLVYANNVTAAYPPDRPEGVINAEQQTMRLGTLDLFARAAAGKFYDHKETREAK